MRDALFDEAEKAVPMMLENCSAGTLFRAKYPDDHIVPIMQVITPNIPIWRHKDRYRHLIQCLENCKDCGMTTDLSNIRTYYDVIAAIAKDWHLLRGWTWPYRAMLDVYRMTHRRRRRKWF